MDLVNPETVGLDPRQLERIGEHWRRAYLEPGKIPGCITLIARAGKVCYLDVAGRRDIARDQPMTEDTVFRIYSMTKPVTSLALMQLYERGLFSLDDPVHRFIPAFRDLRVRKAGSFPLFETVPCQRPMSVRDLLTHTSGLTYDFLRESNIDYAYRKLQVGNPKPGYTAADMVAELAQLPLEFSPGERWNYSLATDVCGHLVELLSGQSLPDYLEQHLFQPLGMADTTFNIRPGQLPRFASCYQRDANRELVLNDDGQDSRFRERSFYSGGGGLLSTAGDYYRFCQMLLNGGSLDGQRVIGSRTLDFMTRNHLPGDVDLSQIAIGSFSETVYEGVGFGLGFATKLDPVANGYPASPGTFFWGGLASTLFWVDPEEDLTVLFMTQLMPSSTFNFRGQLEAMVYAALE
ncbi:serine hydrolase domain-containing protein [Parahaliea mediterranea]|uniref:Beta-lactamase family protein n=1 Tax=Parahaliea mediterranea TaxID=651086 RepID=A0A939IJ58_9GAMM|nr:serine hydrolase domain-containing protein [Parahaliea mediterranea]MBN7797309.1 beta-lactamase family protein [Parahaliea mediterranea]